uniref:Dynein heavy chain tail domain-containing protein n=1 Tax=Timema tahoe TaxID=61484 RepID=A0A7R9IAS4_9NEOP|nr:unnamed protein product [Timema tahoe]
MEELLNQVSSQPGEWAVESYSNMEELLNQFIVLTTQPCYVQSFLQGSAVCDKWVTTCERLTGFIWSNYIPHMWNGAPFVPLHTKNFVNRLGEILQLRTIHRQLTRLLTSREQEELHTADTFRSFSGLCPVLYNPYTEKLWRAAVAQFEHSLVPMEERVAGKLRAQLKHINANTLQVLHNIDMLSRIPRFVRTSCFNKLCSPLQLLYEFKRYQELIERPIVCNALVAERESLLAALREYLHTVSTDFNAGRTGGAVRLVDMPEVICNIYWVRQLECKLSRILGRGEGSLKEQTDTAWIVYKQIVHIWITLDTRIPHILKEI